MNDSNMAIRNGLTETKRGSGGFIKNAGEKAAELWNEAIENSEEAIKETSENISDLWDDANKKYDELKKIWDKSSEAEKQFFKDHPIAAYQIGQYQKGSDNISTVASEFAFMGYSKETDSILSGEDKKVSTGGQNAMRHVLLQAFITSEFGEDIAKQAGDAHENNIQVDMTQTHFKSYDDADMAADQRNNAIGRSIATDGSTESRLELTKEAVEKFREEGFWISFKTDDGFELRQVKLGENRYEGYKKALENKDENALWIQTDK